MTIIFYSIFLGALLGAESDTCLLCRTFSKTQSPAHEVITTAKIFLDALLANQANILAELGSDPFTFDGRVVKGKKQILKFWETLLTNKSLLLRYHGLNPLLRAFDYREAVKRFGTPPKKFSHLKLRECMFVAATFEKCRGMLFILTKNKNEKRAQSQWQVCAVTN